MRTFDEILDEQIEIAGASDNEHLGDVRPSVSVAAERYANQRTQELQAKILIYREEFCPSHEVGWYDQFFGITNERVGENEG
jgi:hypothetical protein